MSETLDNRAANLRQKIRKLEQNLRERATERDEALAREAALAEVLQIINRSPGDLAPVFDAMLDRALRLCDARFGQLTTYDGVGFRAAAWRGYEPDPIRPVLTTPPAPGMALYRITHGEEVVHVPDITADEVYRSGNPTRRRLADEFGGRTAIWVALKKEAALLGAFVIFRTEVRPFSDQQTVLLQNFAAQAVIAIENARLITETRESLEQQQAMAEVLGIINASPGNLQPVFDAILEKAHTLCGATRGTLFLFDGETFRAAASHGYPQAQAASLPRGIRVTEDPRLARLLAGERLIHVPDLRQIDDPIARAVAERGVRTNLLLALRADRALLGVISCNRQEVRLFSDKEIALLENFAAQAVIAIENARLIAETREALEQQTATAEILEIINRSPGDLAPVFEAMLDKALGLCGAAFGVLWTFDGERIHAAALRGVPPAFAEFLTRAPHPVGPDNAHGRLLRGEPVVHIADVAEDEAYRSGDPIRGTLVGLGGGRTLLAVPLRKDDRFLGDFVIYRTEVRPFTDKQIALLENFAAQAVIAMENARLLGELRQRTGDLQESLEYQTATSDVLNFISRSTFDLTPVLEYVAETAIRLCRAHMGSIFRLDDGVYRWAAGRGLDPSYLEIERRTRIAPGADTLVGRVALEGGTVQIADAEGDPLYAVKDQARITRARTMLGVPLLRDGTPIGVIAMARDRVELFNDKEIALVTTFADQAVIAIENVRLITETRGARDTAEAALRELKAAQANLIQAEKMASLGQLTAGIAHEIKNPLNFVNNFAGLSVELLDELKETARPALAGLADDERAEVDELVGMLTGNLEKIAEHGRRADGIVKSMLEHSRGGSGERREVDLNALIEEALNLAYHGARAQDQTFNITLERDFAPGIAPIELAPQEMTRVLLNLFGNGFYAAAKRQRENAEPDFRPTLKVATRDLGEAVEIRIRDNGAGIPSEIRDKLFQPFFTTKPTGEGTGLGLSISWDIVTQQHGGTIAVDSRVGEYTEFAIRLPRTPRTATTATTTTEAAA